MIIEISNRQSEVPIKIAHFEKLVQRMLAYLNMTEGEISVAFVDNQAIAELNWEFLEHEGPTDIITFPLSDPGLQILEAELVISAPWAAEVAARNGDQVDNELALYLAHGLLHLTGQDDIEPDDALEMRRQELELLKALELAIPRNRFESVEG